LISIIEFDISGYKFLSTIEEIKDDLHYGRKLRLYRYVKNYGLEALHPANLAKYRIEEYDWYYRGLFQRVLQMLASEDMIFETGKTIPITEIDFLEDEEET